MPLPSRLARRLAAAMLLAAAAACGPAFPAAGTVPVAVMGDGQPAPDAPAPEPRYAWVQLGADDSWIARAVFDSAAAAAGCGEGAGVRARPDSAFPVLVCEARLGRDVSHAYFFGLRFDRPVDDPRALAVVGGTGCRSRGGATGECDDDAWPFAAVADSMARGRPELLVHLGDLRGRAGVDGWAAWEADFFRPAGRLLAAAPWVFVRGDHESCAGAGEGWFRFFDPGERPDSGRFCRDHTGSYAVHFTWGDLLVHDVACAPAPGRCEPSDSAAAVYARHLADVREVAGRAEAAWLLAHVPLWAVTDGGSDSAGTRVAPGAPAAAGELPPSVRLHLAGHLPGFQGPGFAGEGMPTLVIGSDAEPAAGRTASAVGWAAVEPAEGGWTVRMRRADGLPAPVCRVAGREVRCATP